jgi:hypothetical protein
MQILKRNFAQNFVLQSATSHISFKPYISSLFPLIFKSIQMLHILINLAESFMRAI